MLDTKPRWSAHRSTSILRFVLSLLGFVLFVVIAGRLFAEGINRQLAVEDQQRAAHRAMLVSQ